MEQLRRERDEAVGKVKQLEQKLESLTATPTDTYPKLMYSHGGGYVHAYNFNQERDLKAQGFTASKVQW